MTLFRSFQSHQPTMGVGVGAGGVDIGFNATLSLGSNIEKGKIINIVLGSRKEQLSSCKPKDAVKNMFFCPSSRKQENMKLLLLITGLYGILSTYGLALKLGIKSGNCSDCQTNSSNQSLIMCPVWVSFSAVPVCWPSAVREKLLLPISQTRFFLLCVLPARSCRPERLPLDDLSVSSRFELLKA